VKILGIDTTTKFLSIGVYDGTKTCEYNLDAGTRHSALLMPTIKRILESLDWRVDDLDYFACGIGPGSFTGIRIGLAAVKGMNWATNNPVAGVSTLDILARNITAKEALIMPAIDAKRSLIYTAIYKLKNKQYKRISSYLLISPDEFLKKVKSGSVVLGDAIGLYRDRFLNEVKGLTIPDKDCWYPKGHNIISAALEKIKEKKISNAFNLKPIYLYPKECQIRVSTVPRGQK